eukprot:1969480-Pleurochrysis_carterae.AAC.9
MHIAFRFEPVLHAFSRSARAPLLKLLCPRARIADLACPHPFIEAIVQERRAPAPAPLLDQ